MAKKHPAQGRGIQLATGIHGIDLTKYFKVVGELFTFGVSPEEKDIPEEIKRIKKALARLDESAIRDVYVTVIVGSAGLYMSARKPPLWLIRYRALRNIFSGDTHYDPPHDSVLYDAEMGQIGRLGTIPRPTAAVALDIPRVIKALKSGGSSMPVLSIDGVADGLSLSDLGLLLEALPQFARECSS